VGTEVLIDCLLVCWFVSLITFFSSKFFFSLSRVRNTEVDQGAISWLARLIIRDLSSGAKVLTSCAMIEWKSNNDVALYI
jgi:hypothetical protein